MTVAAPLPTLGTASVEGTMEVAASLAGLAREGDLVVLCGDLGAG